MYVIIIYWIRNDWIQHFDCNVMRFKCTRRLSKTRIIISSRLLLRVDTIIALHVVAGEYIWCRRARRAFIRRRRPPDFINPQSSTSRDTVHKAFYFVVCRQPAVICQDFKQVYRRTIIPVHPTSRRFHPRGDQTSRSTVKSSFTVSPRRKVANYINSITVT